MAGEKIKVYEPETIPDTPLPNQGGDTGQSTVSGQNQVYHPEEIPNQPFPSKVIASELIGQNLDTQAKKILGNFSFTQFGGIQVGEYKSGVSGDIKISPSGIVARDSTGTNTFVLDGTTGNATFKGTVQAGSVISGELTVGGSLNGNGRIHVLDSGGVERVTIDNNGITINNGKVVINDQNGTLVIDSQGIRSTTQFEVNSVVNVVNNFTLTSLDVWTDITGFSMTTSNFTRPLQVFIILTSGLQVDGGPDFSARGRVGINIDGTIASDWISWYAGKSGGVGNMNLLHVQTTHTVSNPIGVGTHTIKGQAHLSNFSGTAPTLTIYDRSLTYIVFGK